MNYLRRNKYNARRTEYNGVVYDSLKEASFAQTLDLLKKAKNKNERVISWSRQIPYKFKVNGKTRVYRLDFRVQYSNGVIKNYEIKGMKKGTAWQLFQLKKDLVEEQNDIVIEVI